MAHLDIIRAWNDEAYRRSLSEAERAQLPAHPTGLTELDDTMATIEGGECLYFPPVGPLSPCESTIKLPDVGEVLWGFATGVYELVESVWYLKP